MVGFCEINQPPVQWNLNIKFILFFPFWKFNQQDVHLINCFGEILLVCEGIVTVPDGFILINAMVK
jgi:hypothetical protein